MVVTRGIEHPHIRFGISSLMDKGLFYDGVKDFASLSDEWRKYFESKKIVAKKVIFMEQVHGDVIHEVVGNEDVVPASDALISESKGVFVAIKTADCLPVLLYDPKKEIVAAVHAGWKGTRLEVVRKTLEVLLKKGSDASDIHAILGPSIGSCCYDVTNATDNRVDAFEKRFGEVAVKRKGKRVFLDLHEANKMLLLEVGLKRESIISLNDCTACGVVAYPSHYKDKRKERLISVIGIAS